MAAKPTSFCCCSLVKITVRYLIFYFVHFYIGIDGIDTIMLWIASTLSCRASKKDGWWLQHVTGARCSHLCSWLCTAAKPTFFSWSGVQAGTRFARSLAEPGMPLPSRCLQQPPTPGSLPTHKLRNTSHGKRYWRKSPHLVSKVLDDKSLIWQTWFFKEGTFIQMSIVEFLGPRVIRAFWHLWKRTQSRLKRLENFSVAKETKKMRDKTSWFAFKLQLLAFPALP